MHSDRRAEEREAFDLKVKQKEVDMEGAKREQEVRRKREDQEEIAKIRKAAVHKAQPIRFILKLKKRLNCLPSFSCFRNYKPIEVKPSEKPLTYPASPNFQAGKNKANSTYSSQ